MFCVDAILYNLSTNGADFNLAGWEITTSDKNKCYFPNNEFTSKLGFTLPIKYIMEAPSNYIVIKRNR